MKKITLVLVTLAFVAGMAVAEDVTLSVSGSATVEWGFAGQLIDNTGSFLDAEVASGDFYGSTDAGDLVVTDAPAFTFTMSVEDADGNVIVEAAANEIALDDEDEDGDETDSLTWGQTFVSSLDYIMFPNVIPGILGITLEDDDALEPDYAPSGSASENERILVDITPMGDALDVTVGLLVKPNNKLTTSLYDADLADAVDDAAVETSGVFVYPGDPDDLVWGGDSTLDSSAWETSTYLSWAASLEATFTAALGDENEVSVGLGTVIDSAFTSGVYIPDFVIADVPGYDKYYSPFTEDTMNEAQDMAVIAEMYGPIAVNPLTMKQMDPGSYGSTDDAKMLRTNEVLGRATIPLGLGVSAAVADLSADVDFQMVLAEGKDVDNYTGIIDWDDDAKSTLDLASYAMPMYAAVDVGYELAAGDMTITPGVNFKYSSDFWKWGWDGDDEEYQYQGDVSGADWIGRPMSLDAGIDVEGIAGMIDVSISASVALGDGAGNHGYGLLNSDPIGLAAGFVAAGATKPSYTLTWDDADGGLQNVVFDNTLAEMIDFFKIQPAAAGSDTNYWNLDGVDADTATDGLNNQWLGAATPSAMGIEVGITVAPIDGLTIENTTNYDVDNLGIGADADTMSLFGIPLNTLTNETVVEYDWMVGDAVAFTIFGEFTYASESYFIEDGQTYVGLRADDADVAADTYEFNFSEAPSMATFDYAVGVKCSVGL